MAFYQMEPFGPPAADDRFRQLCGLLFAINSKTDAEIPVFFDRDPAPLPPRTAEDELEAFFIAMGARSEDD